MRTKIEPIIVFKIKVIFTDCNIYWVGVGLRVPIPKVLNTNLTIIHTDTPIKNARRELVIVPLASSKADLFDWALARLITPTIVPSIEKNVTKISKDLFINIIVSYKLVPVAILVLMSSGDPQLAISAGLAFGFFSISLQA